MPPGSSDIRGVFAQQSFCQLLVKALDERWTGTLVIEPPQAGPNLLEVDAGLVSRALVSDEYARLGELLVDAGVIIDAELDLALAREGLLGQALAAERLIDAKTLQRALVLQVIKRVVRIFALPEETQWTYVDDREAFAGMPDGVRVDTLRVLWAGISEHGERHAVLREVLERIGESPFQLRADVHVNRFGFTGDAARLVGIINGERSTLSRLIAHAIAPVAVVERIAYLLAMTRHLEFLPAGEGIESAEPISTASSSSDAAAPSSSDAARGASTRRVARIRLRRVAVSRGAAPGPPGAGGRGEALAPAAAGNGSGSAEASPLGVGPLVLGDVQALLARLDGETPLTLLGLAAADFEGKDEQRTTEMLWEAFEQCTRHWSPENTAGDVAELREGIAKLRLAAREAFAALLDPVRRAHCLEQAAAGGAETDGAAGELRGVRGSDTIPSPGELPIDAPPARRGAGGGAAGEPGTGAEPTESGRRALAGLSPSQLHERALVAFSEQRVLEATELCDEACGRDPDNPDYAATAVWIRAAVRKPDIKVLLLDLDELLRVHPDHVAARFYRGSLRHRLGADAAAREDFERVLEIDPDHAGARAQFAVLRGATS